MSSPSNRSKKFLDGGGNNDTDALFHAYEEQGSADEEGLIEATFNIRKNLNRRLDS